MWNYKYFDKNEKTGLYKKGQYGYCVFLQQELLQKLDKARGIAQIPFKITSGLRHKDYNKSIGGASNSAHLRGYAVDIYCKDSLSRGKILSALRKVGFNRIGIAKNFIHVDCDPSLPQNVTWLY